MTYFSNSDTDWNFFSPSNQAHSIDVVHFDTDFAIVSLNGDWEGKSWGGYGHGNILFPVIEGFTYDVIEKLWRNESKQWKQLTAIKLTTPTTVGEFTVESLKDSSKYKVIGYDLNHYNFSPHSYGQHGYYESVEFRRRLQEHVDVLYEKHMAKRRYEQGRAKREAFKAEAAALGITQTELRYRKKCENVNDKNDAAIQKGLEELKRSMRTCDELRKTLHLIQKTLDSLEKATPDDLRVRGEDRVIRKLHEVNKLIPPLGILKSDLKAIREERKKK